MKPLKHGKNLLPSNLQVLTHTRVSNQFILVPYGELTLNVDLASAYIISAVSRPDLALYHLKYYQQFNCITCSKLIHSGFFIFSIASSLSPEDPEIAFNLAAVLEACE